MYTQVNKYVISEPLQNNYNNYIDVFSQTYRNCDSMWYLLNKQELHTTLNTINKDININNMNTINFSESYRKNGQTISYIFINKSYIL